jgi:ketosteroid isomerase-like protein
MEGGVSRDVPQTLGPDDEQKSAAGLEPCLLEDRALVDVKPDAANETELIEVLNCFCSGFADRDGEAVMRLFAPDPDMAVVTSEESLLRGPVELWRFLDRYVDGPTTYSWEWDRQDISMAGSVAWLLAEGTETAATEDRIEQHPYRMTMVLERREDRWLLMQVHGSSPH